MPTAPDLAAALAPILDIARHGAMAMFDAPREQRAAAHAVRARLIDHMLGLDPAPVDQHVAQTVRAVMDPGTIDALLGTLDLPPTLRDAAAEAVWNAH